MVLSTHPLHPHAVGLIEEAARLNVVPSHEPGALKTAARTADVIIVRAPLPRDIFVDAPSLRAAIRHGAGTVMIPIEEATDAGVLVANVPGANARSVAEYVIFCALALMRKFRRIDADFRSKGWNVAREHAYSTSELGGKTMGLIGMGNVGQAIVRVAHAMGLSVVAFRPSGRAMPVGAAPKPLDEVIEISDFLVLCCPLTESTRGLMNKARLGRMRSSAFLINVARGAMIVEEDLLEALDRGRIAGAALDVFELQPLRPDHALYARDNVLLTPHLAGITEESMYAMGEGVARETLRVLSGALPANLVNPGAIARYEGRFGRIPEYWGRKTT